MRVDALASVAARIQGIQQRFAAPGFAGALQRAGVAAGSATALAGAPPAAAPFGPAATTAAPPPATAWQLTPVGQPTAAVRTAPGAWAERLPPEGRRWAPAITAAAGQAGIEPPLLAALVWAESGFRADAVSHAGARGLSQLMPATARGLGVDPDDPAANLAGGARYLRAQLDRFGSKELALAAYNAGPQRVARAGGVPAIAETRAYVPRVLDYYARLR